MSSSLKVLVHVTLIAAVVIWHVIYTSLGFASIDQDAAVTQDNCGISTLIMKYTTLNTTFGSLILLSYAIFPGGGEGARARAMVITIIYGTLGAWGVLMATAQPKCMTAISAKFGLISQFHDISVVHNLAFFTLMLVHEFYAAEHWFEADLTLIPEIKPTEPHEAYEYDNAMDHAQSYEAEKAQTNGWMGTQASEEDATLIASQVLPTNSGVAEIPDGFGGNGEAQPLTGPTDRPV